MSRTACALLCVIYLLSLCSPGLSRKHTSSYSRGGGFSGGSHQYPHSSGLSGSGTGHRSQHVYQSQSPSYATSGRGGGGHSYPDSNGGLSGTGRGRNQASHGGSYPPSNGISGNNNRHVPTTNNVHYHYHYTPPQQINYAPRGGPAYSYPVYHSQPPTYVYQYRDSSSKYGTLLAGLSLLNLGMLTASALSHNRNRDYVSQPGEVCKLGIRKENGDYEETKIKCEMISSFIWADEEKRKTSAASPSHNSTSSAVTTTSTNTTTTTTNNSPVPNDVPATLYTMLPNGTLVEVNATQPNGNMTSSVTTVTTTTTTTNTTTVSDALDPKNNGPPVKVTDGTQCYVMRRTSTSNMRHTIPCGLLQSYASKSLKNAAARNVPVVGVLAAVMVAFIMR